MKKLFTLLAATTLLLASCNGSKDAQNSNSSNESVQVQQEEQQIKLGMKARLDSLTHAWLQLKPMAIVTTSKEGKIALSDAEKKVKPAYLLDAAEATKHLETLSLKYRALSMLEVDRAVASAYDMPDAYSEAINKLAVEIDDPAVKFFYDNAGKMEYIDLMNEVYKKAEETGRANFFWESAAASVTEQLYILTQNKEKFLSAFTDKDAEDITFHVSILVDAFEDLAEYNPELSRLYKVICPLEVFNAISVDELRTQLSSLTNDIVAARSQMLQ